MKTPACSPRCWPIRRTPRPCSWMPFRVTPRDTDLLINATGAKPRIAHTLGFDHRIESFTLVESIGQRLQSLQLVPPVRGSKPDR